MGKFDAAKDFKFEDIVIEVDGQKHVMNTSDDVMNVLANPNDPLLVGDDAKPLKIARERIRVAFPTLPEDVLKSWSDIQCNRLMKWVNEEVFKLIGGEVDPSKKPIGTK